MKLFRLYIHTDADQASLPDLLGGSSVPFIWGDPGLLVGDEYGADIENDEGFQPESQTPLVLGNF